MQNIFYLCHIWRILCINPFNQWTVNPFRWCYSMYNTTCRKSNGVTHSVLFSLENSSCCHLQHSTNWLIASASWAELPMFRAKRIGTFMDMGLCKARLQVKQKFMKTPCCNFPFTLPVWSCVEQPATTATTPHTLPKHWILYNKAAIWKNSNTFATVMMSEKQTQTKDLSEIEKLVASV